MLTARSVIKDLQKLGTSKGALAARGFYKTKKGQYGYGDVFLGVTVPEQRKVAQQYRDLPREEILVLLKSKFHECRLTGLLILVDQYNNGESAEQKRIARFYLAHRRRVNNWDLVDSSAPYILGQYFFDKDKAALYTLARSKNVWDRRIAIVATHAFTRMNAFEDTLKISGLLLKDTHDLIHKAVGWMLREVGKRSQATEERFLKKYATVMPRTMLRYAIEKFSEQKRKAYLAI